MKLLKFRNGSSLTRTPVFSSRSTGQRSNYRANVPHTTAMDGCYNFRAPFIYFLSFSSEYEDTGIIFLNKYNLSQ